MTSLLITLSFISKSLLSFAILILLSVVTNGAIYRDPPPYFTSFYCNLGTKTKANSGTYKCLSPRVIPRADRFALSLVEFNKIPSVNIWFEAQVNQTSGVNLTSIAIRLSFKSQYLMRYAYHVLVVGYMTQNNWLDIININLPDDPGSNSLYYPSLTSNQIKDYVVNFPSSASILSSYNAFTQFISSFGAEITTPGTKTEFSAVRFTGSSSTTVMTFRISAFRYVALKTIITGLVVINDLVKPPRYVFMFTTGQNLDYSLNLNLANTTTAPYGPPFNIKCFFGLRAINYDAQFTLGLANSTLNNYKSIDVSPQVAANRGRWRINCIADTSLLDCDQPFYQDPQTNICYSSGTLCPIPTTTVALYKKWCSKCHQPQCITCDVVNHAFCLDCNTTNFVQLDTTSGMCTCMPGYGNTSKNLCTHCFAPFSYCLTCIFPNSQYDQNQNKCACKKGFYFDPIDTLCKGKCGDAIKIAQEGCDDGNLVNGDGCTNSCEEQANFKCDFNTALKSICALSQDIQITLDRILKTQNQNKAEIYFKVNPNPIELLKVDWSKTLSFAFLDTIKKPTIQLSYNNGVLIASLMYLEDIENHTCEVKVRFNESIIDSTPINLEFTLLGANQKLIYKSESMLQNQKMVSMAGFAVGIVALLCFLVSTYFHKLIGLETLQFIQLIYFARVIFADNSSSNVLAFNSLKYSNGYSDINLNGPVSSSSELESIPQIFLKIKLNMYYLDNCNLMLLPIFFATLVYAFYSIKGARAYSLYQKTKNILNKDQFISLRRKVTRVYDNFIFAFSLSLLYLTVFQMLVYELSDLSKQSQSNHLYVTFSFGLSLIILFYIFAIFCAQTIQGIKSYTDSLKNKDNHFGGQKDMSHETIKDYHPLYVPFYLLYQMLLIVVINSIILEFRYLAQTVTGLTILYSIVFLIWKPYSLKIHNYTNIYNQVVLVLFLAQQILEKYGYLNDASKIVSIYVTITLIIAGLILQIVRLHVYRKSLKRQFKVEKKDKIKQAEGQKPIKVNPYSIENQLWQNARRKSIRYTDRQEIGNTELTIQDFNDSSIQGRQMLRKKLRYQNIIQNQMNENQEVIESQQILNIIKDRIKRGLTSH